MDTPTKYFNYMVCINDRYVICRLSPPLFSIIIINHQDIRMIDKYTRVKTMLLKKKRIDFVNFYYKNNTIRALNKDDDDHTRYMCART